MNKILKTVPLLIFALLLAGNAFALKITLDDGGAPAITISDGDAGDWDSKDGVVQVVESIGVWVLNTTIGSSDPFVGSSTMPQLHLSSINASTAISGTHTLTITLTDTYASYENLSADLSSFDFSAGGTTGGSIALSVDINGTVQNFGTFGAPIFDFESNGLGFSGTAGEEFTATITAVITHTNSLPDGITVSSSFGAGLEPTPVPVPATLSLLGLGLFAFAGISRRRAA